MNKINRIIRESIEDILNESNDFQMSSDNTTIEAINYLDNYSNILHTQTKIFDNKINVIKQDINNIDKFLKILDFNLTNPVVDSYNGELYIKFDILNSENWSDEDFNKFENIIYKKFESFKSSLGYDSLIGINLLDDDDVKSIYIGIGIMYDKEFSNVLNTLEFETKELKNNIR